MHRPQHVVYDVRDADGYDGRSESRRSRSAPDTSHIWSQLLGSLVPVHRPSLGVARSATHGSNGSEMPNSSLHDLRTTPELSALVNVAVWVGAVTRALSWRTHSSGHQHRSMASTTSRCVAGFRNCWPTHGNPDADPAWLHPRCSLLVARTDYDFRCRSKNSTIRRRASTADGSWNSDAVSRPSTLKRAGASAGSWLLRNEWPASEYVLMS